MRAPRKRSSLIRASSSPSIGWLNGKFRVSDDSFFRSIESGYRYDDRSAISDGTAFQGLDCANTVGDGSNVANKYRVAAINSPACSAFGRALRPRRTGIVDSPRA